MPDSLSVPIKRRQGTSSGRGLSEPRPGGAGIPVPDSGVDSNSMPAIYFVDTVPSAAVFDHASALGFNTIGFTSIPVHALEFCRDLAASSGLRLLVEIDLLKPEQNSEVLSNHPEWFVASPEGPHFVFLSDSDPVVDWWDSQIKTLQSAGVDTFKCENISAVPAVVWQRLIGSAKQRHELCRFIGWTPGLSAGTIEELSGVGFDFSFSSSCWWDYRASWLNDDAFRMGKLGPSVALATPPKTVWPVEEHARRRALFLAATYAAGWMMPAGFEAGNDYDLAGDVASLNALRHNHRSLHDFETARVVSSSGADVAVLRRGPELAISLNALLVQPSQLLSSSIAPRLGGRLKPFDENGSVFDRIELPAGGVALLQIVFEPEIRLVESSAPDCNAPRLAIEAITPKVEQGQFPVRRVMGETVVVEADIIADGHDKIAAEVLWRGADQVDWQRSPMRLMANDRWQGSFTLSRIGRYVFAILAWKDEFATFVDEITKKSNAGVSIDLELQEGLILLKESEKAAPRSGAKPLMAIITALENSDAEAKRAIFLNDEIIDIMRDSELRKFSVQSSEVLVDAERLGARFASWYEIFPRSQSADGERHGTFLDVINQLPRIADMGFDVLYFPPIHPIGRINRKGKNNTLSPAPDDPGSPYAIGSQDGGHDALHPELGSLEDFQALRLAATKFGIELALDFAIQCAPDHPWLTEHKDWFDWRPDGSLRYAENPPKKYEDIVNVDFYTDAAKPDLWIALRDVVQVWVDRGIKLFRVDNPHTKPLPFWEWLIADIRRRHPDVVFLAEAFTRPKVMYRLAKVGFSQSYTYFTWRNNKTELTEYLTELNTTAPKDYFTPHFFVNTPDINPIFLQHSGRPGFLIRAALAATLSGLWGVYNGFELCEATPVSAGKEEYLDSEKYQIRAWDYDRPNNIVPEISRLNSIRRGNAALQSHLGIRFHDAFDEEVLFFSKSASDGNVILVAVCLDPFNSHTFDIDVPLWLFGLPDSASLLAEDLMRDFEFVWSGKRQSVTLHPGSPFCIWRIRPYEGSGS
jgi:starch synthase (maltosyl-transferring)